MLFNSLDFAIFLPLVFLIYWFVLGKNLKIQNIFVLLASFIFYGWWDWRFLSLLIVSTLVDYFVGRALKSSDNEKKRKAFLVISLAVNLGILGFFKYFNFFVESFTDAFSLFGKGLNTGTLNIVLPVGISFYTFQTLSYSIDVYRRKLEPTKDFIAFAAFVSFFPQLVAGPIERASNLLPQFYSKRKFDSSQAIDGLRQILWGLFKKMVIADRCAVFANEIFNNSESYTGFVLVLGAVFFAFQIYGDFSGYSDIAIGTARLFGFSLMRNFAFPYFSRDIAEFWRRWHISLSTWFRDYLYIPLGGSKAGIAIVLRNTLIVFLVSGFWHGANLTFVFWGLINALYFIPLLLGKANRKHLGPVAEGRILPRFEEFIQIVFTFLLVIFGWIFFRANSISHAFDYIVGIFNGKFFVWYEFDDLWRILLAGLLILFFIVLEWIGRNNQYAIEKTFLNRKKIWRLAFYYLIVFLIFFAGGVQQSFIYFQF